MKKLDDPKDMKKIYDVSKQVFCGELSSSVGCKILYGHVSASKASISMYFNIYSCMRKGTCYKMGTSANFTKFIIESIYKDLGKEAMLIALASAQQNAEYRKQCNNEQKGIELVIKELISKYNLKTDYNNLKEYYSRGPIKKPESETSLGPSNRTIESDGHEYLKLKVSIGDIVFEAEGTPEIVIEQEKRFSTDILPQAIASLNGIYKNLENKDNKKSDSKCKGKNKKYNSKLEKESVGQRILKKHRNVLCLKERMDFKAKMIPLMYLASEDKLQYEFSITEIQQMMKDALGITAERKQIKDVLNRRSDWFEMKSAPERYILLDTGKDYARNILQY